VLNYLGRVYYAKKNYNEAFKAFERAVELDTGTKDVIETFKAEYGEKAQEITKFVKFCGTILNIIGVGFIYVYGENIPQKKNYDLSTAMEMRKEETILILIDISSKKEVAVTTWGIRCNSWDEWNMSWDDLSKYTITVNKDNILLDNTKNKEPERLRINSELRWFPPMVLQKILEKGVQVFSGQNQ
jgi:tetratricopeptide (TPR) repeat protein